MNSKSRIELAIVWTALAVIAAAVILMPRWWP